MAHSNLVRAAGHTALVALVALGAACSPKQVSRIDPATVTDLSGRWNDTDSRLVANELIKQSLDGAWVRRYSDAHGGSAPTVIVGDFANKTYEHIAVGTFVNDLERAFTTSGAVQVVAGAAERGEVRAERADQQQNANAATRSRMGNETGANYMLQGEIQAIEDSEGKEKVVFYQVDATLVDLESNAKVWIGQHKIKKYILRKRLGL
ncbi:MAG: penicillin-binding protein activator LpoB [Gemmatimonadaceae bacterium]|nr:penicillin-binding protein activator LpoB [Gemmatimonadaceae bacterium]NUQ92636.1 penicillin-binding protein activator LpoB [Gemmatimonadaceae bacterium]NUR20348.1 penicillin-binding protein activator LpoB [Gemmatimonadaceae bacterium]NUS95914.1 penicillin-binding protein activator LpoB [Gemmatimonadaceae bacterium]